MRYLRSDNNTHMSPNIPAMLLFLGIVFLLLVLNYENKNKKVK